MTDTTKEAEAKRLEAKVKKAVLDERIKRKAREQVDSERPKPELIIQRADEVPDEPLVTLFGGRLIQSAFQLMVGPGDAGKGMQSADIMARLSTGEPFPGEGKKWRKPIAVLVCVTEDSKPRVKARLRAASANLKMVNFVSGRPAIRGGLIVPSPIAFDDDAGPLLEKVKDLKAGALFLETTLEHLGDREGKRQWSTNSEAEVRRALSPIVTVCREGKIVGWGVMHPRKSSEGGIEDSISGSAAFRNVGRSILHVYPDPSERNQQSPGRLLISSKANYLARRPPTLRFRIEPWEQDPTEGRVVWGIEGRTLEDPRSAEEIWQQIRETVKARRDFAVMDAEQFLRDTLAGDAVVELDELKRLAKEEGISWISVRRAKDKLKVESPMSNEFPARVLGWRMPKEKQREEEGEGEM